MSKATKIYEEALKRLYQTPEDKILYLYSLFPYRLGTLQLKIEDIKYDIESTPFRITLIDDHMISKDPSIELYVEGIGKYSLWYCREDEDSVFKKESHFEVRFIPDEEIYSGDPDQFKLYDLTEQRAKTITEILVPFLFSEGNYTDDIPLLVNIFPDFAKMILKDDYNA